MSSATKKPNPSLLEKHADEIRKELRVDKQNEVFRVAVEAGYLAALADGKVDDKEREAIVAAVRLLSAGAVIEWEVEAIVDEAQVHIDKDGKDARAKAIGAELQRLGQPDAGLLFAAAVAQATGGIDGAEKKVLEAIGEAAGLKKSAISPILRKAGAAL
jgi:tellurite resistance protein